MKWSISVTASLLLVACGGLEWPVAPEEPAEPILRLASVEVTPAHVVFVHPDDEVPMIAVGKDQFGNELSDVEFNWAWVGWWFVYQDGVLRFESDWLEIHAEYPLEPGVMRVSVIGTRGMDQITGHFEIIVLPSVLEGVGQ